jgi:hypothetical protein
VDNAPKYGEHRSSPFADPALRESNSVRVQLTSCQRCVFTPLFNGATRGGHIGLENCDEPPRASLSRRHPRDNNHHNTKLFVRSRGLTPMFINDTGRLPESGRVCVIGFQPAPAGESQYFSLHINAARAEVEPMAEPRNAHHVLGVGAQIASVNGPVFAAYFAVGRERYDAQPDYRQGLFVLVDGAVYAVKSEHIDTSIRRGFRTRRFTLLRADRPQRSVEYRWPWYREPFTSGAPATSRSADFLCELSAMVREYGRR